MRPAITSADWFPSRSDIAALHSAAMQSELEWERALVAAYGRNACCARYTSEGTATPELAQLCQHKRATYEAFRLAAFPHARR